MTDKYHSDKLASAIHSLLQRTGFTIDKKTNKAITKAMTALNEYYDYRKDKNDNHS